jgi:phosphate-selective porin OprO/OprP
MCTTVDKLRIAAAIGQVTDHGKRTRIVRRSMMLLALPTENESERNQERQFHRDPHDHARDLAHRVIARVSRFRHASSVVVLLLVVGAATPHRACRVSAQSPEPPPSVRWDNGVTIDFGTGEDELQFGGLIQLDGRFAPDDPLHAVTDTLLLRRVRPILQGRVSRIFEFRIMPDFGNGQALLFDAYFDMKLSDTFRVRMGKDKTPIGLELLYADYAVRFPERSLVTNLVPNRDIGIQAVGQLAGGRLSYVGAIFNGVPDGNNGDITLASGKDLVGRVALRPFGAGPPRPLQGLDFALGGSVGRQTAALPVFRTSAQQVFFSYASNAKANGARTRLSPSTSYHYKFIGALVEYARSSQEVATPASAARVANQAWGITGSLVLTGEPATERGVKPRRPYSRERRHWGAFEVVARHAQLEIDPAAFAARLADPDASRTATATGAGLLWYLNQQVKYVLTFERTAFEGGPGGVRPPEHAIIFRLQLNLQPTL